MGSIKCLFLALAALALSIGQADTIIFSDASYLSGKMTTPTANHLYMTFGQWTFKIPKRYAKKVVSEKTSRWSPSLLTKVQEGIESRTLPKIVEREIAARNFGVVLVVLQCAQNPSWEIRQYVFSSLRNAPCESTVHALFNLLYDAETSFLAMDVLYDLSLHKRLKVSQKLAKEAQESGLSGEHAFLLEFLGKLKCKEALHLLPQGLCHVDPKIVIASLNALGMFERPENLHLFLPFLQSEDRRFLKSAAIAIGRSKTSKGIPYLIPLLKFPDEGVKKTALWALHLLSGKTFPANFEVWLSWWERESFFLDRENEISERLKEDDEREILDVLKKMDRGFPTGLLVDLERLISHDSFSVRLEVCRLLEKCDSPEATGLLVRFLGDADARINGLAYEILKRNTGWELPNDIYMWDRWHGLVRDERDTEKRLMAFLRCRREPMALKHLSLRTLETRRSYSASEGLTELLRKEAEKLVDAPGSMEEEEMEFYVSLIHTLRILNARQAVPVLTDLLSSPNERVKKASQTALLQINQATASPDERKWKK